MKKRAMPFTVTTATKKRNTVTPFCYKDEPSKCPPGNSCITTPGTCESCPKHAIQWGLQRAIQTGLRIIEPKPNELQLDIDSVGLLIFHEMQYSILEKAGITKGWKKKITKSKRGGSHLHVTITAPKNFGIDNYFFNRDVEKIVNVLLRLLFQSLLGSDLKREAFNTCRVLKGNKYPIVFFEKDK
jgi:hypothetical protein